MSDSIYKTYKPTGGGDYLKLRDGDRVKLRIASEPAISVYKAGQKPRYSWVVFNRDVNQVQVYSAGVSVFNAIADMVDDWGDPQQFDISIKRTGSTMQDTTYSVTPVKISADLSDNELEEITKIDLIKAIKGKWLSDYMEDGELPEPITEGDYNSTTDEEPAPPQVDPIDMDDLPDFRG